MRVGRAYILPLEKDMFIHYGVHVDNAILAERYYDAHQAFREYLGQKEAGESQTRLEKLKADGHDVDFWTKDFSLKDIEAKCRGEMHQGFNKHGPHPTESKSHSKAAKSLMRDIFSGKEKYYMEHDYENAMHVQEYLSYFIVQKEVKDTIRSIQKRLVFDKARKADPVKPRRNHMILEGPPGTGKTTFGRVVSRYLKDMEKTGKGTSC